MSEDRPGVVRTVDERTGRESGKLSDAQVDEIVRFVKTIRGVDHRVQQVDGTEPHQVLVHTGSYRAGRGHGDLLRIEKQHGHWILVSKSKWKFADLIEQEY